MSISTNPDKYKDDPVGKVLDEYNSLSEADDKTLSESSLDKYERVWRHFEDFMEKEFSDVHLLKTNQHHLKEYRDNLLQNVGETTAANYLGIVGILYNELVAEGAAEANPASYVLKRSDLESKSPERREIPLTEMRRFVQDLKHPFDEALIMTMLKFGPRVGAVANIDFQCVNLDHQGYKQVLNRYDIELHEKIANESDAMYIYQDIDIGDVVNGDQRVNVSNKRKRDAIVPIDDELKGSLLRWLAIRPETPELPAQPLFIGNGNHGRYSSGGISSYVVELIKEVRPEWRNEAYDGKNVSAHYFRHYFDTMHREGYDRYHNGSLEESKIKYLRGDVLDDSEILNVYTHDWGLEIRQSYLENVYKLF